MVETLVELDERRRLSLGKVGKPEHRRYLAHEEPDGTIVLVPAVVMSESQARLLANAELVGQIERTVSDPSSRVRRGRPTRKG
jgi:RES domain-containing protein